MLDNSRIFDLSFPPYLTYNVLPMKPSVIIGYTALCFACVSACWWIVVHKVALQTLNIALGLAGGMFYLIFSIPLALGLLIYHASIFSFLARKEIENKGIKIGLGIILPSLVSLLIILIFQPIESIYGTSAFLRELFDKI